MVKEVIPALRLTPKRSKTLLIFILTTHIGAVGVVVLLPLNFWLQLLIVTTGMVSLVQTFRTHLLCLGRSAIRSVEWDSDGEWTLFTATGDELAAQLKGSSYVQPWLVILNFSIGRFGRRSLLLLPDAVDPDLLRRLRVRLRLLGNLDAA